MAVIVVPQPIDPIAVLGFSTLVRNGLHRWDITTVRDLLACSGSDLMDIPSFGPRRLYEVIDTLGNHGLELKESQGPLPPRPARPFNEQAVREQVAADLLAVDPVEWALAGQHAGSMAARIARGEH